MTDIAGSTGVSDPFTALGLPTRAGLSDDDVRAAWRRIAAATHPDREDGGEPARFGAAAAAYAMLRTAYGRGEALADLGAGGGSAGGGSAAPRPSWRPGGWTGPGGKAGRAGVRAAIAVAVASAAFLAAGWAPSSIGVLAGAITWLLVTSGPATGRRR